MSSDIIKFSQNVILIQKQKPFYLQITNKNQSQSMIFKIKTTRLQTYEVKPPLGSINPLQTKKVQFKLVKPLTENELEQINSKDKFQLQFLLISPAIVPKTKAQYKILWDNQKKDASKEANFVYFTFPIQIAGKPIVNDPFSPIKSKNSFSKVEAKNSNIKKLFTLQSDPRKDEQMSKQFEKLKEKEQRLLDERQKIFKSQPKAVEKGSKSGAQIALRNCVLNLVIFVFLASILIGNFLKLRVVYVYQQV